MKGNKIRLLRYCGKSCPLRATETVDSAWSYLVLIDRVAAKFFAEKLCDGLVLETRRENEINIMEL